MKVRYLFDEHVSPRLKEALLRHNRSIEILRVGDHHELVFGIGDREILTFSAQQQYIFVTQDYNTMFTHITEHIAAGNQHCGVLVIRPLTPIGILAVALYEIWYCTDFEDWNNVIEWIPL